jgi:probable phosphoglycerate mutase
MKPSRKPGRSLFLLVARHAESRHNTVNRIQGHCDSDLTPRGRRQADLLAKRLAKYDVTRIYSSDLGRTMATTRFISERIEEPIMARPGLREIRLGRWEGLTPEEVNSRFKNGYNIWRKAPSRMKIPGAESIRRFSARVRGAIDGIVRKEKSGIVLVMTHGGVIASLLADWMKGDFDTILLNLKIDNTGVTVVEFKSGRLTIHAINDISHLKVEKANELEIFAQRS